MKTSYDAIIVGAGPAGNTAAILLASAGWSVALIEKQPFPRRKVCGACIGATRTRAMTRGSARFT
jgi:flavin-dependent dehydrogenase